MKYGFVLPSGDARAAATYAKLAEDSGWDGFFMWEPVWGVDAWIALTAAAMRTERVRLGTMLTPLPRRKPWDLAGQVATLDNLSDGRVTLSVGLGAVHEGWLAFEPDQGRRVRAGLMDEGLAILAGLWKGQPFAYEGRHYTVRPTEFAVPPPPVQRPRVPVWVVGGWPAPRSMGRAARWDGWLPNLVGKEGAGHVEPRHLREGVEWIRAARAEDGLGMDGYDVVAEGVTPADDPAAARAVIEPWSDAGATWWIESNWSVKAEELDAYLHRRLSAGPPTG
jgi:alkanesulfonate monooxygenase SsuD/methylene tetrahydromethanopterin reductase-like flavin-dependent oxidoreductase (luciferase family)